MKRSAVFCGLLGLLALVWSLAVNRDCFEVLPDGAGWQTYLDYQSHDRAAFSQQGVDALQGNFDAYYPLISDFTLPGALYRLVGKSAPGPAATYAIYIVALVAGMFLLCRFFRVEGSTSLVAMLIAGFFFPPAIVHWIAPTFRFFALNPHWLQVVILSSAIILAVWALDGKWSPGRLILICVPAACATLEILSVGAMIIFTPAVALYCGGSVLFSRSRSELAQKLLAAVVAVAFLVATGQAAYLYGLEQYSAYQIFGGEFDWDEPTYRGLSIFFASVPFGSALIGLGLLGAVATAIEGCGRLRQLALTHLAATALFFLGGIWNFYWASHHHYLGSAPLYFETTFLPFAAIFAAAAIARAVRLLIAMGAAIRGRSGDWASAHAGDVALWGFVLAVVGFNVAEANSGKPGFCASEQVYATLKPTAITEILQRSIALRPGGEFRGIAVTLDWLENLAVISCRHMNRQNEFRWRRVGNDHRIFGLWRYDIPTMYQYFTFITAPYYLVLTEFLARPQDRQTRSGLILSRTDPKMLRLWGVRYVITDDKMDVGQELASLPLPEDRPPLRLLELDNPNLGNYSPTQVREVSDFHAGLLAMHEPGFDGAQTVVTNTPIQGKLTAASNARLTYETYGFRIEAESAGKSLLVLPAQFSRCWSAEGDGSPQLFRANLMQLGVEFTGKLDARLVFRYGPWFASGCRLEDVADIRQLKIDQGRVIPRIIPAQEPKD